MARLRLKNYHKINMPRLCQVLGWLVMIESLFMLIPLATAIYYDETEIRDFGLSAAITLLSGFMMVKLARPKHMGMGKREGFLLTAMVWIVFSLFGMLPFLLSPSPYTVSEAFLETMSGFTTTGAQIVPDVEVLSHSEQMWRALMQWIGGLGIVIFTVAVLPMLNHSGGLQLYNAEVTGITHEKLLPRISQTAKALWLVYIGLTALCILFLCIGPVSLFDGLVQSLGTISTGGFSPYNNGINAYNSQYVKVVITVFMFLGGVNFALIFAVTIGRFARVRGNLPFRWFAGGVVGATAVFFIMALVNDTAVHPLDTGVDVLCQTVSVMTTTSYAVDGSVHWGPAVIGAMIVLMFIGGCAGSTSGGAKIDRIIVLLRYCANEVRRSLQPNSVPSVKMGDRTLSQELVMKVVAFLCIDVLIIIVGGMIIAVTGVPVVDAFYSCVSAIANSGLCIPGLGEYGGSFVPIPDAAKWVLALIMMVGRLEIFTVAVLFTRDFWHK